MLVTVSKGSSRIQGRFIIELHTKDLNLLYEIKDYFGGIGSITITNKVARFTVVGLKDIIYNIIPHFLKYPLQSDKSVDFDL